MKVFQNPERLASNPYPQLLFEALRRAGADVQRYTARRALTESADILHFHWPEQTPPASGLRAQAGYWARMLVQNYPVLEAARARGARVCWTVHNLASHDGEPTPLQRAMRRRFLAQCDATFHLTDVGREIALASLPALADKPAFVVPHGPYPTAERLTLTREEARRSLGLPVDGRIALYFGMIRPYKNVGELIDAFLAADDPRAHLVIAGKVHADHPDLEAALRARAGGRPNVTLRLEFLDEDDLGVLVRAADCCVFPYREIFNSGSVHYALSAGRAAIVPDTPVFAELAARFGDAWVRRYPPPLCPQPLVAALNSAPGNEGARPDLSGVAWSKVADATISAYQSLAHHA